MTNKTLVVFCLSTLLLAACGKSPEPDGSADSPPSEYSAAPASPEAEPAAPPAAEPSPAAPPAVAAAAAESAPAPAAPAAAAATGGDVIKGWKAWRAAACERCHGPAQEGMVGPSLIASLATLTKEEFSKTVLEGRIERGMPGHPFLADKIDDLYAYLKGRSDGSIAQVRPDGA